MYLEKLPKEDGGFKKVGDIDENRQHTFIDVTMTSDLLCAVEQYSDWLKAFQEHYNQRTGETAEYRPYAFSDTYNCNTNKGALIFDNTDPNNYLIYSAVTNGIYRFTYKYYDIYVFDHCIIWWYKECYCSNTSEESSTANEFFLAIS